MSLTKRSTTMAAIAELNDFVLLTSLTILIFLPVNIWGEYTAEDCTALGYNKANLLCSVCDQFTDFNLGLLRESCFQCCNKDVDTEPRKKYAKARLEVCTCRFGAYPQVQAFIKSDRPAKFPNLSIRYVRGLDPIIKLLDEDDNVVETLAIDKWNTDSIEEFLTAYLQSAPEKLDLDYLQTNMV